MVKAITVLLAIDEELFKPIERLYAQSASLNEYLVYEWIDIPDEGVPDSIMHRLYEPINSSILLQLRKANRSKDCIGDIATYIGNRLTIFGVCLNHVKSIQLSENKITITLE